MTTYSDRPAVRRRIVEVLAATPGLADVQVSYGYPGAVTADNAIWLGDIQGSQEMVDFGSSRPGRDDRWRLSLAVAVAGAASEQMADERCQQLVTCVCEALFASPRLGDGFKATALYPGDLDGPNSARLSPHEPAISVAQLTIEIHTPLRGV